jgi:transcriptional regulator NrdR family protein
MTACRHTRSKVTASREEGHTDTPKRSFRYIKFRRRECLDCGAKFVTFELTDEQLKRMATDRIERHKKLQAEVKKLAEECGVIVGVKT